VEQDDDKADQLFKQACDSSHQPACYNLGAIRYLKARDELNLSHANPDKAKGLQDVMRANISLLEKNCEAGEYHFSCPFAASYFLSNGKLASLVFSFEI